MFARFESMRYAGHIADDAVAIWLISVAGFRSELPHLAVLLDAEERARIARRHFVADRETMTVARGCLRLIAGRCLGREPGELSFVYNAFGKPSLDADQSGLEFNVSHSQGLVAIALARGRLVGVDVEGVREMSDLVGLSRRYFSVVEQRLIEAAPADQQTDLFFEIWTHKEAYIKAIGRGLSQPLDRFHIGEAPNVGQPQRRAVICLDQDGENGYFAERIAAPTGYQAAVVAAGEGWRPVVYQEL